MPRQVEHLPPQRPGEPPVEVVRSTRRRSRATAFVREGRVVVQLPANLPADASERTIGDLVARVTRRHRADQRGGDAWLAARAELVGRRWLDGARATRVSWSDRMSRRWASATPADGSIRVSSAAAAFPDRVVDYLLVHELAHLRVPDHSPDFHDLVAGFPDHEWARGFLAGVAHAAAVGSSGRTPGGQAWPSGSGSSGS